MIVRPTSHHIQIEIDVKLPHDEYNMNALMINYSLLIYKNIILILFFLKMNTLTK